MVAGRYFLSLVATNAAPLAELSLYTRSAIGVDLSSGVSELSTVMAMHQSTTSNLIEKLVKSKLISGKRESSDQRVITLFLTEAGSALLSRAPRPARGRLPEALYQLPRNALSSLDKLLERVLHRMGPTEKDSMKKPLAELLTGK